MPPRRVPISPDIEKLIQEAFTQLHAQAKPMHCPPLCQTPPHPPFLCPQWFWSLSHQACSMRQQPGQNGNVSLVDPLCPPTLSKLNSTHFHKHTVTSHSKLWNSIQKIQHSKLTVLTWELRSRISNSDSIPRKIDLKSGTNSRLM
jgi:hypothetical protein